MGIGSIWHWIIVLLVVLVLFGRGRVSEIMGDFGKGINSFKKGLADDESKPTPPSAQTPPAQIPPAATPAEPVQQTTNDQLPR